MATNVVSSAIVPEVLTENNYAIWSVYVKNYLMGHDLWETVKIGNREAEFKTWRKKNAMALHAIQISCGQDIFSQIREISSAKEAWDFLATMNEEFSETESLSWEPIISLGDPIHTGAVSTQVSSTSWTALHYAICALQVKDMEELVQGASGQDLVDTATPNGLIPVEMASIKGHKYMVRYLYPLTREEKLDPNKGINGATLLCNCIAYEIFDVALDLLQRFPKLAVAQDREGNSPVLILSQRPSTFPSGTRLVFWQWWIYKCIHVQPLCAYNDIRIKIPEPQQGQTNRRNFVIRVFGQLRRLLSNPPKLFGIKQIYDTKMIHLQAIELLRIMCKEMSSLSGRQLKGSLVSKVIFEAVKYGRVEFIKEIINTHNPNLLLLTDEDWRNIFMLAVKYRQEEIFSLIYGLNVTTKGLLTSGVDKFGNNMLHLATMPAPPTWLHRIYGEALQMQRELQWFKVVERIVPHMFKESKNEDNKTPQELFTENHLDLVKRGEKWMKDTSYSCTVVAALIVTIMFAAAFTFPGGYNDITGFPIFSHKKLFLVFISSDALSLLSSSTSSMIFLDILTSRYAEESFLKSLPKKLVYGLGTLFISIGTMMIAFCAALFLILRGQSSWVFGSVISLASVPVTLFILSKFPLLVEILISTYRPGKFNMKTRHNSYDR